MKIHENIEKEPYFCVPIWKWKIHDISELEALIPIIYKLKEEFPEGNLRSNFAGWQSSDDLHHRPEFKDFTHTILNIAEHKMNVDSQAWGCAGLWANINPPGAGNNVHLHEGVISGAVWLQCDTEKSGGLAFVDPRIRSKMSGLRGSHIFQNAPRGVRPVVGMGVMFPCWLEHYVMENKDDKDRISMSFNLV